MSVLVGPDSTSVSNSSSKLDKVWTIAYHAVGGVWD